MEYINKYRNIKRFVAGLLAVVFFVISTDMIVLADSLGKKAGEQVLGKNPEKPREFDTDGDGKVKLTDVTYFEVHARETKVAPGQAKKLIHEDAELWIGPDALDEERDVSMTPLRHQPESLESWHGERHQKTQSLSFHAIRQIQKQHQTQTPV